MPDFTVGKSPETPDLRQNAPAPTPSIGRIVRYVTPGGNTRPAIITGISVPASEEEPAPTLVDLEVFGRPVNNPERPRIVQGVEQGAEDERDTWHWPPRG